MLQIVISTVLIVIILLAIEKLMNILNIFKEVQWIDNVLTLVDKKPKVEIKTYDDLIANEVKLSGYVIIADATLNEYEGKAFYANKNVAASEKVAKSMLAMAQISQLMPYYGGEITDEEWKDGYINKFMIYRVGNMIRTARVHEPYQFLAFHTEEQRNSFLKNNERLVKDYLMLD